MVLTGTRVGDGYPPSPWCVRVCVNLISLFGKDSGRRPPTTIEKVANFHIVGKIVVRGVSYITA